MSELMKALKLIELSDWVLNLHPSGFLYRYLCALFKLGILFTDECLELLTCQRRTSRKQVAPSFAQVT